MTLALVLQILSKYWREVIIVILGLILSISGQIIHNKKVKIMELKLQIAAAEKLAEEQKLSAERAKNESDRVKRETNQMLLDLQSNPPKGVEATRKWALVAAKKLEQK